ncbi:hypothetical protein OGAPHI_002908 [Ogataea philodendri]|uniref:Uncharacterized protein n=1 Tax=Ogataea philodendri TaxID=1378263 RepID=A0A9P8P9P4_9ASCO|nr:uncharacterized protein OGAPHI_002908 [Ogataea philodendri]KAH3667259.1 hypothetical protein OGAPHI_002908 [Ogataea philodendri]
MLFERYICGESSNEDPFVEQMEVDESLVVEDPEFWRVHQFGVFLAQQSVFDNVQMRFFDSLFEINVFLLQHFFFIVDPIEFLENAKAFGVGQDEEVDVHQLLVVAFQRLLGFWRDQFEVCGFHVVDVEEDVMFEDFGVGGIEQVEQVCQRHFKFC